MLPRQSYPIQPPVSYHQTGVLDVGIVDRWLNANIQTPSGVFLKDCLMISDSHYVTCVVEREWTIVRHLIFLSCLIICLTKSLFDLKVERCHRGYSYEWTLYLTAYDDSVLPDGLISPSPRIILERFVGSGDDRGAPQWTWRIEPRVEFRQPRATIAELFIDMAKWEQNVQKV
jgi:hypothetical protein